MEGEFGRNKQEIKRMQVRITNGAQGVRARILIELWDATGEMQALATPVSIFFPTLAPASAPLAFQDGDDYGTVDVVRGQAASAPVTAHMEVIGHPADRGSTTYAALSVSIAAGDHSLPFYVRCGNATYYGTVTGVAYRND